MIEFVTGAMANLQDGLFTGLVEPVLQRAGLASYLEDGYAATEWLLVGGLQVLMILGVMVPLEGLRPFERPAKEGSEARARRHAVRIDIVYTLIDRLGLMRLALFFLLDPLWNRLYGHLAVAGFDGWHLDQWIGPWWPGVTDTALAGFVAYAIVLDWAGYGVHRAQHRYGWWWALHAVHHSQRHMTCWTDSRNHLLDTVIVDSVFVLLARVIGVPPGQFVMLVALSKLVESLAHANVGWSFGRVGERLMVGPRFHRVHHGIDEGTGTGVARGPGRCNYGVLLPLWDLLFGTARFDLAPGETGVRDPLSATGRLDDDRGFWAQQALGLRRLFLALRSAG